MSNETKKELPSYWEFLNKQYGRGLKYYIDATRVLHVRVSDWLFIGMIGILINILAQTYLQYIAGMGFFIATYFAITLYKDRRILIHNKKVRAWRFKK